MPDQRVVERIDAWAAAGLIDEATADRLRAAEAGAPAALAARALVDAVVAELRGLGAWVQSGRFGADMLVELANDGPVTVLLEL